MPPSPPEQSYIIWFSQRVGSTLLSQALEDTGVAGRPREWLYDAEGAGFLAKYRVEDASGLREALWRRGTTTNGVFGVKYGMGARLHGDLTSLFAGVLPEAERADDRRVWEAFFPNCRHVFMTRRNKLRLAVSWWRAIKTGEWHRPGRSERTVVDGDPEAPDVRWAPRAPAPTAADLVDQYDRKAIQHLMIGADLREADMQEQFDRWGVVPYTIVYEDFVASYEETLRGLLDFLDVPGGEGVPIPPPAFQRLADDVAEAWVQRFAREYDQKGR